MVSRDIIAKRVIRAGKVGVLRLNRTWISVRNTMTFAMAIPA